MQGAAAWGFPSWLPHPLASLDKAPPVPQASPWRTLEVSNEWGTGRAQTAIARCLESASCMTWCFDKKDI